MPRGHAMANAKHCALVVEPVEAVVVPEGHGRHAATDVAFAVPDGR